MILRYSPIRFKTKSGRMCTQWIIERLTLFGWEWVYQHGVVSFWTKAEAEEFIRIYKSLKK